PGAAREPSGAEAPRPARVRINGRSPGSRVAARHRLPGRFQWRRGTGSPLTVAGAAVALEPLVPHHIPCSLSHERPSMRHLMVGVEPLSMRTCRAACEASCAHCNLAWSVPAPAGRKRERGESFVRSRGCPRNCERQAFLDVPLEPREVPGRPREAMNRKPGDLPTQSFATTSSGGGRMGDYMKLRPLHRISLLVLPLCLAATPAFAHHVMGGKTPSTVMEGLLSGLGHPVIGPDHLAFLVALGIVVGVGGLNLALPALFVAAMAVGVMVHVNGIDLPTPELIVAVSVLLAGVLIAVGRALPVVVWSALFVIAGLFHGYAFGES